jgi:hypothetical protein
MPRAIRIDKAALKIGIISVYAERLLLAFSDTNK